MLYDGTKTKGVVAGEIWHTRHQFNIEQVNVNGGEIEIIFENILSTFLKMP